MLFILYRYVADLEKSIVSVERIREYQHTPTEAPLNLPLDRQLTAHHGIEGKWPSRGEISFENYSTRYREGLDLVLRNVSFKIRGGEKVGIVGRTGELRTKKIC